LEKLRGQRRKIGAWNVAHCLEAHPHIPLFFYRYCHPRNETAGPRRREEEWCLDIYDGIYARAAFMLRHTSKSLMNIEDITQKQNSSVLQNASTFCRLLVEEIIRLKECILI
jgi:hypothetical protein